jgi:hypothetical protein
LEPCEGAMDSRRWAGVRSGSKRVIYAEMQCDQS